jgi:hypothetical protein
MTIICPTSRPSLPRSFRNRRCWMAWIRSATRFSRGRSWTTRLPWQLRSTGPDWAKDPSQRRRQRTDASWRRSWYAPTKFFRPQQGHMSHKMKITQLIRQRDYYEVDPPVYPAALKLTL